jgi:hypothetical protein
MKKRSDEKESEIRAKIVAFLHITKDGNVVEKVGLDRIPRVDSKFVAYSRRLLESVSKLGSELNLGDFQSLSMIGKKGKLDLQILLHLTSPSLYGIIFTEKRSLEERLVRAFKV